jgi:hypothetical protein
MRARPLFRGFVSVTLVLFGSVAWAAGPKVNPGVLAKPYNAADASCLEIEFNVGANAIRNICPGRTIPISIPLVHDNVGVKIDAYTWGPSSVDDVRCQPINVDYLTGNAFWFTQKSMPSFGGPTLHRISWSLGWTTHTQSVSLRCDLKHDGRVYAVTTQSH